MQSTSMLGWAGGACVWRFRCSYTRGAGGTNKRCEAACAAHDPRHCGQGQDNAEDADLM
jgi:hypothetical protein